MKEAKLKIETIRTSDLVPYAGNAKIYCNCCAENVERIEFLNASFVPERTCRKVPGRMKYGRRMPACSECGYSLGDDRWYFCPKCGAKVTGLDVD